MDELEPAPAAEVHRDEYNDMAGLNWSRLNLLRKSPANFKLGFGDETSALKLGTAAHMAILEAQRFEDTYIIFDGRRDKRTKAWQEFETAAIRAGKLVMIQSEMTETLAIRDAVMSNPTAAAYLRGGAPEVTRTWKFKAPGVEFDCKGRMDYVGPAIVDLKTTQCCEQRAFQYSAKKYGYYGQGAWYSDGDFLATGVRRPFVIIAVESSAPYLTQVFTLGEAEIEYGRELYMSLLGKLDYCTKRNFWGGYSELPEISLGLPTESN